MAQFVVNSYLPPPTNANATVLKLEFNAAATPTNVQPGYQTMTLTTPSVTYNNTTKVTVSPWCGLVSVPVDRDRNTTAYPNSVSNIPPAFTTALIYNSFIFDDVRTAGSGIDILVQHLAPNTVYGVYLCSYDPETGEGDLTVYSDWTEAISGTVIAEPYSFGGGVATLPTVDG